MEISVNTFNVTVASVLFVSSYVYSNYILRLKTIYTLQHESKKYTGSCHCNKVIFDVIGPKHLVAWDCNCSICYMKKNWHFIVPRSNFTLISGSSDLTEYRFNTKVARHMFCSQCGVQAYYIPRSNPDGVAITLACIPQNEIVSYEMRKFDGYHWEDFIAKSGINVFSKKS